MRQTQDKARNLTMMMDEYELTMANAYFNDPTIDNNTKVSFDVYDKVGHKMSYSTESIQTAVVLRFLLDCSRLRTTFLICTLMMRILNT